MSGIEKDLGPKGLVVLEGAINEGADIPAFVQQFQPGFPVGTFDRMLAGAYMQLSPMVRAFVPFMLFIDRNGMIQAQYTGGDDFLKEESAQDRNIREEALKLLKLPRKK